jgi:hypothetical protein
VLKQGTHTYTCTHTHRDAKLTRPCAAQFRRVTSATAALLSCQQPPTSRARRRVQQTTAGNASTRQQLARLREVSVPERCAATRDTWRNTTRQHYRIQNF